MRDECALPRRCRRRAAERTKILSTGGHGRRAARAATAETVLVATETGMLHQLRKANPPDFRAGQPGRGCCKYMKMITPEKLSTMPAFRMRDEVTMDSDDVARASSRRRRGA